MEENGVSGGRCKNGFENTGLEEAQVRKGKSASLKRRLGNGRLLGRTAGSRRRSGFEGVAMLTTARFCRPKVLK